ncbi:TPA: hypothetical protein PA229_000717 [Staphylococcus aureus]|uniref:hypothetical protein n=1 Tax=Staphylococcus aureus TaxID=1280 RepID=UPI000769716A|nr:hypothetical protein [Staphylococcus aureus]CXP91729.1 Uncharacterised protein [Staphylococcus aureus]CXQ73082.1 Uncharacterised protein [Staphylococcus aureus]HDD2728512.1 hypothetical protein [Staphylococcus aureus]HDD3275432.1 hypothetical protein [Staphylococcus aureus]HDD3288971.1 hypothetical protein [Staphylococcus aureus]
MKKFNNWILNAISGSQTDKNETTEELKGAKFIILYAYSMLVLLALVISNIFEPKLSITTQIIIVLILIETLIGLRFLKAYDVKRGKDKENKKNSKDFVKLKSILVAILFTSLALTAGTVADIYGFTDLGNTRSDLIVWSIGGIIFGLVCYTMEDKK